MVVEATGARLTIAGSPSTNGWMALASALISNVPRSAGSTVIQEASVARSTGTVRSAPM